MTDARSDRPVRPDPATEGVYSRLYRAARRQLLRAKKPWIARRLRRVVTEEVDGVRLVIPPGVHNPVVFRAGVFLARTVARLAPNGRTAVLDVGTGSGISAIFAARRGYSVCATDINALAVACARANAVRNEVDPRITVLEGDLCTPFMHRTFDIVTFNPPFFVGRPRDMADMAWRSTGTIERFAEQLPSVLKPTGQALVAFSSDGDERTLHNAFCAAAWSVDVCDWLDLGNEILTVYSISLGGRG